MERRSKSLRQDPRPMAEVPPKRHPNYPVQAEELRWATNGHCYIATEAMYHLWAKDAGYVPHVLNHGNGSTHWWLVHSETGEVIDPTEPQLDGEQFPYELGHKQQFLTPKPSRRAQGLMRRMSDSKSDR